MSGNFKTFPILTDDCTRGRVCPANFRPAEITITSDDLKRRATRINGCWHRCHVRKTQIGNRHSSKDKQWQCISVNYYTENSKCTNVGYTALTFTNRLHKIEHCDPSIWWEETICSHVNDCLKTARHVMSWMGCLACTNRPVARSRTVIPLVALYPAWAAMDPVLLWSSHHYLCVLQSTADMNVFSFPFLRLGLYQGNSGYKSFSWVWWINSMWVWKPQNSLVTCPSKQPLDHFIAPVRVKWT